MVMDLEAQYIFLQHDGQSGVMEGGETFWSQPPEALDRYGHGWLVTQYRFLEDWTSWEMHPEGDEVIHLSEGEVRLLLEREGVASVVEMKGRCTAVIPRGAWHTVQVIQPARALLITMGAGTQLRPVEPAAGG